MPKNVPAEVIQRWRRMASEGRSFRKIAKATRWDQRTVAKYLKDKVLSREILEARRELLKERIGRHWDMLLDGVVTSLGSIRELAPDDVSDKVGVTGPSEFNISGAKVLIDHKGKVTVEADARQLREWDLLLEHTYRDPLWLWVHGWEKATALDLDSRRALFHRCRNELISATGWQISENKATHVSPPVLLEICPALFYEEVVRRSAGMPKSDWGRSDFTEEPDGKIRFRGRQVAVAPGRVDVLCRAMADGASRIEASPEARAIAKAIQKSREAAQEVHRAIQDLNLLAFLPGTCSLCGRLDDRSQNPDR